MPLALPIGSAAKRFTPEERAEKLARYRAKRERRNFRTTVKYQSRKMLADLRPRINGRFARDGQPGSVPPHQSKKAQKQQQSLQQQLSSDAAARIVGTSHGQAPAALQLPGPAAQGLTLHEAYLRATIGGSRSDGGSAVAGAAIHSASLPCLTGAVHAGTRRCISLPEAACTPENAGTAIAAAAAAPAAQLPLAGQASTSGLPPLVMPLAAGTAGDEEQQEDDDISLLASIFLSGVAD